MPIRYSSDYDQNRIPRILGEVVELLNAIVAGTTGPVGPTGPTGPAP